MKKLTNYQRKVLEDYGRAWLISILFSSSDRSWQQLIFQACLDIIGCTCFLRYSDDCDDFIIVVNDAYYVELFTISLD